ncbi:MAG TPA: alpha/beta fold hydrolase [Thermoanaerobaculia bacterium]|nr:alpha/beta fold hydrolase [Thermoanaerobaculia bacterium]
MARPIVTAGFLAAGFLVAAFVLVVAFLVLRQDRLLYFPSRRLASSPVDHGLEAADLSVVTDDSVRLYGWWIRGAGQRVLLYFPGNAGNVADRLERAKRLHDRLGLDVFLVDYRGYGRSEGSPSEDGLRRDGRAIYRTAIEAGFRPDQIVVFGESLGAAVAIDLAARWACAGLVLETPFLSVREVARVHYPFVPSWLVRNAFDNGSRIADVGVPKLFFVAERDEVVPAAQGRRLFERARGVRELYVIPGARHNDTDVVGGDRYWKTWEKFLAALAPAPSPRTGGKGPG